MDGVWLDVAADRTKVSCNIPSPEPSGILANLVLSADGNGSEGNGVALSNSKVVAPQPNPLNCPAMNTVSPLVMIFFYRAVNGHDTGQGKPCRPA